MNRNRRIPPLIMIHAPFREPPVSMAPPSTL
jgi:hypothetical protein